MKTLKQILENSVPKINISGIELTGVWTGQFLDRFGKKPIYDYISADARWKLVLTVQDGNTKSGRNKKASAWDIYDMSNMKKSFAFDGRPLHVGRPIATEKTLSKAKSTLAKIFKTL